MRVLNHLPGYDDSIPLTWISETARVMMGRGNYPLFKSVVMHLVLPLSVPAEEPRNTCLVAPSFGRK